MTPKPPDLQAWIEAAGGYHLIDWKAWHDANAKWRREREDALERDMTTSKRKRGSS